MAHRRRSTNTQTTTVASEYTPLAGVTRKQGKYLFDEIPLWQQDNHYIRSGYVLETNSFKDCFNSLFYLHNETVNIFTHLIPGFLLPLALLLASPWLVAHNRLIKSVPTWLMDVPVYETTSKVDNFMFNLFFFGFASCLTLSAAFHATKCHSYKIMKWGSSLDYVGIISLIVTEQSAWCSLSIHAFGNQNGELSVLPCLSFSVCPAWSQSDMAYGGMVLTRSGTVQGWDSCY
ncbi:hypothetical protein KL942_004580 [Ogataea angusta]|uniref:Uncharacterized protein n=1 Tax=Pichia angusta TaxID=870730 RepID=A0ABQ7RS06_PICAN|nr:hypothetical protein KL942_004580 [Ogataea angusta]KAG7846354.1 hypothetical protein KL940_004306 [Ogataea angusta]